MNSTERKKAQSVKNKASSAGFSFSSVKNVISSNIKLTIYNSLFLPFTEYGISSWGRNKCSEMKQIYILQKRAIRIIHNSKAMSYLAEDLKTTF